MMRPNKLAQAEGVAGANRCELLAALQNIVGYRHLLTRSSDMRRYATGYRSGAGACLAVVRPATLVDMWRVLQACVSAKVAIIVQAANTGLTGGSTPDGSYECDVVIINTLRMRGIRALRGGEQVVCLAGASLNQLERFLRPVGREPHSVIGSSCIGASVVGGICNNSGGALVRRGPAYTEFALYARLSENGQLELVNHLGIDLGRSPEEILTNLETEMPLDARITASAGRASDNEYERHVRDVEATTPARFNADPRRLHEASGCAGKLAVFAVRLDTFPAEAETATFYLGTNDPERLSALRRQILTEAPSLPIAAEYIHRDAFRIAERFGKDTFIAIGLLGADRLPLLYRMKTAIDAFAAQLPFAPRNFSDRLLQALASCLPQHLPKRLRQFGDRYEHHLLLKVPRDSIDSVSRLLSKDWQGPAGEWIACTPAESAKAFLHRFVTAGAAVRYRAIHPRQVEDIVALDIALPRNEREWVEKLPADLEEQTLAKLYYGHFFCLVFHQDYLLRKGADPLAFEHAMWAQLDLRRAEYPAEHNVGHLYKAKPSLARHYQALDPLNAFNPGIGQLSRKPRWT